MADKFTFDSAEIQDAEWEKVKIARANARPNAKSSYGRANLDANATKELFDAPSDLLREKHNKLVESLKNIEEGEQDRTEKFNKAQAERQSAFDTAQAEREKQWDAELSGRQKEFDEFFGGLDIVHTPGDSENKVMSQKGTTQYVKDYIPKVATRNLLNVTWVQAFFSSDGEIAESPNPNNAATLEYIPVTGGADYTFSWSQHDRAVNIFVWEYKDDYTVIKNTQSKSIDTITTRSIQLDAETCFIRLRLKLGSSATSETYKDLIPKNFQMELGTTPTAYIDPLIIDSSLIDYSQAMNEDANKAAVQLIAEKYIPKGTTRNLLNVTFQNAMISTTTGVFSSSTLPRYAAAPEYISVTGGEKYTFSWSNSHKKVRDEYIRVIEYKADYSFIKSSPVPQSVYSTINYYTLSLDVECAFVRIYLLAGADTPVESWEQLIIENFQMESGGRVTDYIAPLIIDPRITVEEEMPVYVVSATEEVIDKVIDAQGGRTFTFAAITDMHYGNRAYIDGVNHACKALKYIDKRIKLDAVAVLGDYTDGSPAADYVNTIADFRSINKVLDGLRFAPNLRIQGNHDYYEGHTSQIHRYIQAYSDNVVWGDISGGYFYKDFEGYKLRVICVNTSETGGSGSYICSSSAQYQWFASMLDLSTKEDASEWQILILSHQPLDWFYEDNSFSFANLITAYAQGGSFSNDYVSYDFTGKNVARLIGNIHGHIHNLLVGKIGNTDIVRIATPEACIDRANQYTDYNGGKYKEETTYNKTVGTVQETSFAVYCVDLDNNIIKSICYGAGYDREITY